MILIALIITIIHHDQKAVITFLHIALYKVNHLTHGT